MFSKELTLAGHTRRFMVNALGSDGWEVRVMQDRDVVRRTCYSDWHRVERAIGVRTVVPTRSRYRSSWG